MVMKRCAAAPYEGPEPYVFISYCHRDRQSVFPVIEQLARDGYRLWYDEGIDPGEEWPEVIARHLNGCTACIAFVSGQSLNSHNCRREINFTLLKKKTLVTVILEPVQLSLGMEMQLSATQAIFKYRLTGDAEFYEKIYDAVPLRICLGEPDLSIRVSRPEEYADEAPSGGRTSGGEAFADSWFFGMTEDTAPSAASLRLIRVRTGETLALKPGTTRIGRSETAADWTLKGNAAIGRVHATVVQDGRGCFLTDNRSKNGTWLNGRKLQPDTACEIRPGDRIRLADEELRVEEE